MLATKERQQQQQQQNQIKFNEQEIIIKWIEMWTEKIKSAQKYIINQNNKRIARILCVLGNVCYERSISFYSGDNTKIVYLDVIGIFEFYCSFGCGISMMDYWIECDICLHYSEAKCCARMKEVVVTKQHNVFCYFHYHWHWLIKQKPSYSYNNNFKCQLTQQRVCVCIYIFLFILNVLYLFCLCLPQHWF